MSTETKNKIFGEIRENFGTGIALIVAVVIFALSQGCASQVCSILHPDKRVTRPQLKLEIDQFMLEAEQKFAELDEQEKFKTLLLKHSLIIAETGSINPVALLTTLGSILGLGAVTDNVRKRKVIHNNLVTYIEKTKDAS